jgi:hypothetical protein
MDASVGFKALSRLDWLPMQHTLNAHMHMPAWYAAHSECTQAHACAMLQASGALPNDSKHTAMLQGQCLSDSKISITAVGVQSTCQGAVPPASTHCTPHNTTHINPACHDSTKLISKRAKSLPQPHLDTMHFPNTMHPSTNAPSKQLLQQQPHYLGGGGGARRAVDGVEGTPFDMLPGAGGARRAGWPDMEVRPNPAWPSTRPCSTHTGQGRARNQCWRPPRV